MKIDTSASRPQPAQTEDGIPKTIRMPGWVWDVLEADAKRGRRSLSKHLEALAVEVYQLEQTGFDAQALDRARQGVVKEMPAVREQTTRKRA